MQKQADKVTAFVDGKRVRALYVIMRFPILLITEDSGTHEATRVFVVDGACRIGDRQSGRLGPAEVTSVSFVRGQGLTVSTTRGELHLDTRECQASWVP